MPRLLIDCTHVFEHPEINSGIQRVVRNVVRQIGCVSSTHECIPVIMRSDGLYRVICLAPLNITRTMSLPQKMAIRLDAFRNGYWYWSSRLERIWPLRSSPKANSVYRMLCKAGSFVISLPLRLTRKVNRHFPDLERSVPIRAQAGDQLVLLDSSWQVEHFSLIERLKNQGVGIVAVIYDLIPLTNAQYFDARLVRSYEKWFGFIVRVADGFIAISRTVSEQVRGEIQHRVGEDAAGLRWHDHFQLGSDLDLASLDGGEDPHIPEIFSDGKPVYLMVGTIEPRKNHAYLLDVFEMLWRRGSPACLCIIGKIGWKCEPLIERIHNHPEYNRRLFMINGLTDNGLEYAYRHSRALLFPSFVEGFGLPLVEAMQRGLPAMGSDIPVFREVGQDFMTYFQLDNPASLAEQIDSFEQTNVFPAPRALSEWHWPGWRESTQQFVDRVLAGTQAVSLSSGEVVHHAHRT